MEISQETRELIREIRRHVVSRPIWTKWRSKERMPGAGERRSPYRGAGYDFDGNRPYAYGDDPRRIDWKRMAATEGRDITIKQFLEPRELTAFILTDVSHSMTFGTERASKRTLAAEISASLVKSLDETKDRVGLTLFSGAKVEKRIPSKQASAMMTSVIRNVVMVNQSAEGTGGGLAKALKVLPTNRCLVYIVSDFINMNDEDWAQLAKATRRHDVRCYLVEDIRERELPDLSWGGKYLGWLSGWLGGFVTLQDWTGERKTIWVNRKTRERYSANFRLHEAEILAKLAAARARYTVLSTEEGDAAYPKIVKSLAGR